MKLFSYLLDKGGERSGRGKTKEIENNINLNFNGYPGYPGVAGQPAPAWPAGPQQGAWQHLAGNKVNTTGF